MSRRRRSDYRLSLGWILGVTFIGTLTRLKLPQWSSLSFGAAVCLRLPPHTTSQRKLSRLATDHATCSCLRLTVATNSPRKGLSPPIQCPCRAHQSCIAGSRLFVQTSILDEFLIRLLAATNNLVVGHPYDPETQVAPLIHPDHRDQIEAMIERAKSDGAQVLAGGTRPADPALSGGIYYLPTILSGLPNNAEICREEVFGPVLSVLPFQDERDVIEMANDNEYGLAAGLWSRDFPKCWRVARAIHAGTVWINTYKQFSISTPFGGDKASGTGREKGREGMRAYMRQKAMYVDLSGAPHPWARLTHEVSE